MRILIVEDDEASQLFLDKILERYGERVLASNGKEAVRLYCDAAAAGERFDVIFMDIMMPEMNGLLAIERIREFEYTNSHLTPREAFIIVATALEGSQGIIDAYCQGTVLAYLTKPLDVQEIEDAMQRVRASA